MKTKRLIILSTAILLTACMSSSDEELSEMDKQRDISLPALSLLHTLSQIDSVYYTIDTNNVFWQRNPELLQTLQTLKDNQQVLSSHKFTSLTNNGVQVVSFVKASDTQQFIYIGNFSSETQHVKVLIPKENEELLIATYINLLTNDMEDISSPVLLKPFEAKVLLKIKSLN